MCDLIQYALEKELPVRNNPNIPSNVPFGLEIEMESVSFDDVSKKITNIDSRLKIAQDRSLKDFGLEIGTPVLYNKNENLKLLKKISKTIKLFSPTYENCAFQINLDNDLTLEQTINLLKIYGCYEKIINRFSMSYKNELRRVVDMYAGLIRYELLYYISTKSSDLKIYESFKNQKAFGINFKEQEKKLIEFRTPNSCDDYNIWFNYINAFYNLCRVVKEEKYDLNLINHRYKTYLKNYDNEYMLNRTSFTINEKELLEFIDLIFNEETDKLYFIKQYIGKEKQLYIKKRY